MTEKPKLAVIENAPLATPSDALDIEVLVARSRAG